jgi:glycerol-3-phosphate dehydrogenase
MMFYDAFTGKQRTVPKHQFFSRTETQKRFPRINRRVLFTGHYYDGAMHTPERLCMDLLLDGKAANSQAQAVNYLAAVGAEGDKVILQDQISGETLEIHPKVVINAAGPWIDIANARMGVKTRFIGGTYGSHLILDNPELRAAIGENEFFFENDDGRIVLIYPLLERVMVGTTDIPIEDPDQARCTEEEIDYFIRMVKIVFPDILVRREQIVFQFTGVRPLPASDADNPGQISRDHSIEQTPATAGINFPIYSLVGGKWTSFRAFSEQVADLVLGLLKLSRKADTRTLAIGGGRSYPREESAHQAWVESLAKLHHLQPDRARQLLERYGTRAEAIAAFITARQDTPLETLPSYSRGEIEYIVGTEMVIHLDDFFLRRSMLAKLGNLTRAAVIEVAHIVADALGWTTLELEEEIERANTLLKEQHRMKL